MKLQPDTEEEEDQDWPALPSPLPDLDLGDSFDMGMGHSDCGQDLNALNVKVDMMYSMIEQIYKKLCMPSPSFPTAKPSNHICSSQVPANNDPTINAAGEQFNSPYITLDEAFEIKSRSCSPGNFARNLVEQLFTKEEQQNRNISGTKKQKLDGDGKRIKLVKDLVFRFYSISPGNCTRTWMSCVTAIDEFLQHKPKSNKATD